MKGGDEIEFILAGGKERVDNFHGNLDFDFGLFGILLVEDMNDQVVALLGDAYIAIVALHGDEFAVFGGADGVDEGAEVYVIDMGVIDFDLTSVEAILVDGGQNFFGEFEWDVDADSFTLGVRADDADVQPAVFRDGCR
jgi:hypothetical protein